MVGRLSLPEEAPELPDSKRRSERALDSPDSGLPPSPSPASWLAQGLPEPESTSKPPAKDILSSPNPLKLCPLSFGEGVAFDPLPPKDVRYTSSVKYDSEKHFINNVYMPVRLGVSSCSQTIICVPDSTWRSYKAEVQFHLCNRPGNFTSTTIVYPKHTKTVYTTTLDYNCKKFNRKFLSSVELESSEMRTTQKAADFQFSLAETPVASTLPSFSRSELRKKNSFRVTRWTSTGNRNEEGRTSVNVLLPSICYRPWN